MTRIIPVVTALGLGACTLSSGEQAAVTTAETTAAAVAGTLDPQVAADGTLFCEAASVSEPIFAAVTNVNVIDQTAIYVAAACKGWNPAAVPVPAPAVTSVPVVTVTPQAA